MAFVRRMRPELFPPFKCQILQTGNIFWPEDKVKGTVILTLPTNLISRGFVASLIGQAGVNFTEGIRSRIIFDTTVPIYGNLPDNIDIKRTSDVVVSGQRKLLKSGVHKFPYEFTFGKDLPCSFTSPNGSIRYQIVVYILGDFKFISKAEKTIILRVPTIDLLNDRALTKPLIYKAGRSKFKMLFKLEKKLLIPKEDISFTLELYNCTSAKATISLMQRLDFKATLETKTVKKRIWSISREEFEIYWTEYFKTPESIPPTNFGCPIGIIDVNYFIKLEVENNEGEKVNAEIPIKVGAPLKKVQAGEEASSSSNVASPVEIPTIVETRESTLVPSPSFKKAAPGPRFFGENTLASSIPAYSDLSLYSNISTVETLPPSYEEANEEMRKLSL